MTNLKIYCLSTLFLFVITACSSVPLQEQTPPVVSNEQAKISAGTSVVDESYYGQAKSYFNQADYESVIKVNDSAVSNGINSARLWNISGLAARHLGQFGQAETSYLTALNFQADHLHSLKNLAILYDIYLQDLTMAMQYYLAYQSASEKQGHTNPDLVNWMADLTTRMKTSGQ